jgi:hypothetical protein
MVSTACPEASRVWLDKTQAPVSAAFALTRMRSAPKLLSFVGWVDGSWVKGEAGVGEEPDHQVVAVTDPLDALGGDVGDLGQGGRG